MSAPDDVRACPFCGNAKMEIHHNTQVGVTFLLCGDDRGRGGCGAVVSFRPNLTGSKAIQAYNRRAAHQTLEQMRDWVANTPASNGWQAKVRDEAVAAIDAHLLSQDAEIERLTRENGTMRRALETLDAIGHKRAELAESRLAVADALLSRCFVQIGELAKGLDPHDPIYVELQQLGLDWMQHSEADTDHLSENA